MSRVTGSYRMKSVLNPVPRGLARLSGRPGMLILTDGFSTVGPAAEALRACGSINAKPKIAASRDRKTLRMVLLLLHPVSCDHEGHASLSAEQGRQVHAARI